MEQKQEAFTKEDIFNYLKENLKLHASSKPLRVGDANVFTYQISLSLENKAITSITFNA